jgi:uncharacterized membrane protein YgcG
LVTVVLALDADLKLRVLPKNALTVVDETAEPLVGAMGESLLSRSRSCRDGEGFRGGERGSSGGGGRSGGGGGSRGGRNGSVGEVESEEVVGDRVGGRCGWC